MNKTEKIICILLGAVLAWYIFSGTKSKAATETKVEVERVEVEAEKVEAGKKVEVEKAEVETPSVSEKFVVLENDEVQLVLSSWGAVVREATLKKYAKDCGEVSEENPAVVLDFASSPLGAISGVNGLAPNAAYEIERTSDNEVVFSNAKLTRKITLKDGYQIEYDETFRQGVDEGTAHADAKPVSLSIGAIRMGDSKNDLLSVDSFLAGDKGKVVHHGDDDTPLKPYLVGGLTGGCSGSKSAAGMPEISEASYPGAQKYVAMKNRFFVVAMASSSEENAGFAVKVSRDTGAANYRPRSIQGEVYFHSTPKTRTTTFFVGPKKQSLLWDLGMKDVMEFGMWRWLCYPLVWVLNLFHGWIPNFGVAIILLTILVRVLFWPLTHKSTVGMKKMQELQPKMKAIQAKFKDNPQRLQQETWALYKAEKVNPMSSCLPMLIQIPVFIALFNVLRSAVELRYAPFLWIADLSEPEGLFASWFPFGGLNLLPILMAVTTGLQSAFTPSTGDKNQQKMMMVFMPIMMLVMFYSFPSALSLYWFLSNVFSIVQMYFIRRAAAEERKALVPDEIIDPPITRQMRRHG